VVVWCFSAAPVLRLSRSSTGPEMGWITLANGTLPLALFGTRRLWAAQRCT